MSETIETPQGPADAGPVTVAAVDLGSNSFHMVIARVVDGDLTLLDRIKEPVRLASGLDEGGHLGGEARARALECLGRFGQRVRDLGEGNVRAVGTNTLRQARDARLFLEEACQALGHPIEVIGGREEARLIYLGVAHSVSDGGERRLVVDIGGGSTECILGEGFEPIEADSLFMGCVSWGRFFGDGWIDAERMQRAVMAARVELEPIELCYRQGGWKSCIGSSGTIQAIEEILRANARDGEGITPAGLDWLTRKVVKAGSVDRIRLDGLRSERAPVLPGGLAILKAVFEGFEVDRMKTSTGALREGLLHDLLGRIQHHDARDATVARLVERHDVDLEQAQRVEETVLALWSSVAATREVSDELARRMLRWAARIHEIGLTVRYSGYQKHGAYLVENSDMYGFSRDDQQMLAALILGHRRRISRDYFDALPTGRRRSGLFLTLLLRLAVVLNRGRSPRPLPELSLIAQDSRLILSFPPGWLDEHPLTRVDLEEETDRLSRVGFELVVGTQEPA